MHEFDLMPPALDRRPLCLLLHGHAQSGKDTVARYLHERYGFITESFARPLKRVVSIVFGIPQADMEDGARKAQPCAFPWDHYTPRQLLQLVGTELFREHVSPDVWVQCLASRMNRLWAAGFHLPLCITDCRFPNELTMPKQLMPQYRTASVRIIRNLGPLVGGIPGHASEQDLRCDHTITNYGTIEDLHEQLDLLLELTFGITPPADPRHVGIATPGEEF